MKKYGFEKPKHQQGGQRRMTHKPTPLPRDLLKVRGSGFGCEYGCLTLEMHQRLRRKIVFTCTHLETCKDRYEHRIKKEHLQPTDPEQRIQVREIPPPPFHP